MNLSNVVIEKGVPLPGAGKTKRAQFFPLFAKMLVGDSFAYPVDSDTSLKSAMYMLRMAGTDYRKEKSPDFFLKVSRDGDKHQLRCWRLKECANPRGAAALKRARDAKK